VRVPPFFVVLAGGVFGSLEGKKGRRKKVYNYPEPIALNFKAPSP